MNRWIAVIAVVAGICCIAAPPMPAASGFIFAGKVAARDGRPVAGAEVQLLDGAGNMRYHVFSDLGGLYRFPVVVNAAGEAGRYRIEISHLRYQPVRVEDAIKGARVSSARTADLAPGEAVALLASAQILSRDFVLTPSQGTPQHPTLGPLDPNFAEYCYQQANLLLRQQRRKEAVEYLRVYAQIGGNSRQIAHSLQLLMEHDK